MAKIELKGFDVYIRQLQALYASADKMCKAVVFEGAAILANGIRQELVSDVEAISDHAAMASFNAGIKHRISESQKQGLIDSLGISVIGKDRRGRTQCSVGFAGYNSVQTDTWPNGQPNAMIARSLNKGTSYMYRDAFVDRAIRAHKEEIIAAMQGAADAYIEKKMKENGGVRSFDSAALRSG